MLFYCLIVVVVVAVVFKFNIVHSDDQDCRKIKFNAQTTDKVLIHHVIRSVKLPSQDLCEISCYKEPDCVSYNYGPKQSEKPWCDLNNRTYLQVSTDDFVTKEGYTYRDVLVRVRTLNQYQSIRRTIVRSITQTNFSLRR